MKFPIYSVLAAFLLIGCGDDAGATATEEDTGGGIPLDTATDDTSADSPSPTDTGGTPTDTGTPPADTMMTADAPAMTTAMKCAAVTCDTATQECCITAGVGLCIAKGGVCAAARYGCTSPTNCPSGQVCCASGAGTGGASCTAAGSCPSSTLCDSNANCSGSLKNCCSIGSGIKSCTKNAC